MIKTPTKKRKASTIESHTDVVDKRIDLMNRVTVRTYIAVEELSAVSSHFENFLSFYQERSGEFTKPFEFLDTLWKDTLTETLQLCTDRERYHFFSKVLLSTWSNWLDVYMRSDVTKEWKKAATSFLSVLRYKFCFEFLRKLEMITSRDFVLSMDPPKSKNPFRICECGYKIPIREYDEECFTRVCKDCMRDRSAVDDVVDLKYEQLTHCRVPDTVVATSDYKRPIPRKGLYDFTNGYVEGLLCGESEATFGYPSVHGPLIPRRVLDMVDWEEFQRYMVLNSRYNNITETNDSEYGKMLEKFYQAPQHYSSFSKKYMMSDDNPFWNSVWWLSLRQGGSRMRLHKTRTIVYKTTQNSNPGRTKEFLSLELKKDEFHSNSNDWKRFVSVFERIHDYVIGKTFRSFDVYFNSENWTQNLQYPNASDTFIPSPETGLIFHRSSEYCHPSSSRMGKIYKILLIQYLYPNEVFEQKYKRTFGTCVVLELYFSI